MSGKNDADLFKFPQVVVVEASAGSGKTLALAKRYLELLINPKLSQVPIPLASVLAITFTNKATLEMKERILELLKKIALDSFSSPKEKEVILNLLGLDEKKAKYVASAIVDRIMHNYNFFQVQTIDSFINALLLGCALNIDRSGSFKIKRNYQEQLAFCLDLVIDQAPEKKEVLKLLEEFLDHYLFVENRKGWFPKEDILGLMQSLFSLSNKQGRPFGVYKGKSSEVIKLKKHIYRQIFELAQMFPRGMNATAVKSIENFLDKSKDIFDIAQIPQSFADSNPPLNKSKTASEEFVAAWRKTNKRLVELVELDATVAYNAYITLFHKLLDSFQIISKKEDLLFLEELNRKVRLLFDQEGLTVSEAYYRLATRFKHYLIDEFQDTSILQWRNLEMMVEDALASGGSLFYVGDKKQAIYRFRGGEAALFDEIKVKFSRYNVIPRQLTNNWRSQKAIIDFNNLVFSRDNLAKALSLSGIKKSLGNSAAAVDEILDIFKDAVQKGKENNSSGYVSIEPLNEKNQEERNQIMQLKIVNLIRELAKRFRYEDIALLTRNNSEVELISSWLLSENIPVESEKTLNVIENPLIKEIICFLKFLHSPISDLNFAGFILGEIFTKITGISKEEIRDFIFEINSKDKYFNQSYLYRKFSKQYPQLWVNYCQEFFKNVGFISVYELTASIYQRLGVFDKFPNQEAFFLKFLELIKKGESEYSGLGGFLEYLAKASPDELYVTVTHSDSVKVLTVHKSKGLEFPVVIIPFLRMEISPEAGAKGANSYCLEDTQDLGLVRITRNHRLFSKKLQKLYADSYRKACIDELNNIYVAFTRPQHELYVFIPKKSGPSLNKATFLIPKDFKSQGVQQKYASLKKTSQQPALNLETKNYKNWIEVFSQQEVDRRQIINRRKLLAGNIMHTLLDQVGNCFNKDRKKIVGQAISALGKIYPDLEDFSGYKEKLEKLLETDELKAIFYVDKGEVVCEKEVVDRYGDLKRVDRLIIREKAVTVVDYKSTASQDNVHEDQLKGYLKIFSEVYPQKQLKGFIVYLDSLWLKEVKL